MHEGGITVMTTPYSTYDGLAFSGLSLCDSGNFFPKKKRGSWPEGVLLTGRSRRVPPTHHANNASRTVLVAFVASRGQA